LIAGGVSRRITSWVSGLWPPRIKPAARACRAPIARVGASPDTQRVCGWWLPCRRKCGGSGETCAVQGAAPAWFLKAAETFFADGEGGKANAESQSSVSGQVSRGFNPRLEKRDSSGEEPESRLVTGLAAVIGGIEHHWRTQGQ
jgi:hypothetical protein